MRLSFRVKCLFLCATLLCLARGRIHFYSWNVEKQLCKKAKQFGKQNRLYDESENGNNALKRKHKPKGRPLAESQITSLTIQKADYFDCFGISSADEHFKTASQKAHCKRGPPQSFLWI